LVTLSPALRPLGPPSGGTTDDQTLNARVGIVFDDAVLVMQILLDARQLGLFVGLGTASFSTPSRVNTCTSITVPDMPDGRRSEVSFTSEAFSPKIARNSFSSGVSWVSPLA